jgi:hypothetical protein
VDRKPVVGCRMCATTYGCLGVRAGVGVGLRNINLEQYARQDQIARVSRATVAEATTGGSGHGQRAYDRHLQTLGARRR